MSVIDIVVLYYGKTKLFRKLNNKLCRGQTQSSGWLQNFLTFYKFFHWLGRILKSCKLRRNEDRECREKKIRQLSHSWGWLVGWLKKGTQGRLTARPIVFPSDNQVLRLLELFKDLIFICDISYDTNSPIVWLES